MMINARPLLSDEAQMFRAPALAVLISSLESPRTTNGPRTGIFSSCSEVPSNLSVPRPPWLKVRLLLMHQSGLQEPLTASRHVFPAVRSKGPIISDWSQSLSVPKKRNVERACDDCRRRKTRCDGPKMPDNVCTNCVQNRKICTYVLAQCPLFQFIQHWFASPQRSLQTSRSSKGVRPAGCCLLFTVSHNVHPVTSQVWKTESKRWRPYWNACVYYSIRPFSPVSAV